MTASGGGPRDLRLPTGRTAPGNYDLRPFVPSGVSSECTSGWDAVTRAIHSTGARVVTVECYPGVARGDVLRLAPPEALVVDAAEALRPPDEIRRLTHPFVTDDPVFGRMNTLGLRDLFDPAASMRLRERISSHDGRVFVHGTGASMLCDEGLLVYAGLPRWEATLRQRRGESSSLGLEDAGSRPGELYKRALFVDWRVADRHRKTLWDRIGFFVDTTERDRPKLVDAQTYYRSLASAARRPLRVVPTFDPAPWGGHWIQRVCDVGQDRDNIGWCFDCIPEENSLLLGFGDERFECPSIDLVFRHPRELLGEAVFGRFGDEFPIRFDFLDTIGGGNLSLQVHPLTAYIREKFGIPYTQDESYYLLDAEPHASVLLGLRTGIDPDEMVRDLRAADQGRAGFDAERYVNRFEARRHDHFLIPAGTVHCSGAGSMVLEISATPYIFTFKLWDWDRPGLDGRPRPTHIGHGAANIQWDRDTDYAKTRLINRVRTVASGPGWVEERTGLHEAEFIETRRHWFSAPAPHPGGTGVNVLNLVGGAEAVVESPDGAFDPLVVHYAETFIVPAAAGPYTVRPLGEGMHGTIKAYVRTGA